MKFPGATGRNSLKRFAAINDATMEKSVHDIFQSLFFNQHGIHRGLARGTTLSSLCSFKGSFDITLLGSGSATTLNFAAVPNLVAASDAIAFNVNSVITNPYNPASGGASVTSSGPFVTTNPCTEYRVVSFSLKFIPSGSALNQSGEGLIAYNPSQASNTDVTEWTRSAMDNLSYTLPWRGNEPVILQWVPNDAETSFQPNTNGSVFNFNSLLQVYLIVSSTTSFRVEYTWGIEYKPNITFRPFVEKMTPKCHPDSYYYVNMALDNHWDQLMLCNYDMYRKMCLEMGMTGTNTYAVNGPMGSYKRTGKVGDADVEYQWPPETENDMIQETKPSESGLYNTLKGGACTILEEAGLGSCDQPMSFVKTGAKVLKNMVLGDPTDTFMIMN